MSFIRIINGPPGSRVKGGKAIANCPSFSEAKFPFCFPPLVPTRPPPHYVNTSAAPPIQTPQFNGQRHCESGLNVEKHGNVCEVIRRWTAPLSWSAQRRHVKKQSEALQNYDLTFQLSSIATHTAGRAWTLFFFRDRIRCVLIGNDFARGCQSGVYV